MKRTSNTLFNVLWWIFGGWVMLLGQILTGVTLCISVVGIPLGIKYLKIVPYICSPFGKVVVTRFRKRPGLNFLNLFFGGFLSFIFYKIYAVLLYCTVILIPFGRVISSLGSYNVAPWGSEIVKEGQLSSHGLSNYDLDVTLRRFISNQKQVISLKDKTNIVASDLLLKTYFEDRRVAKNLRSLKFPKLTSIGLACLPIGAFIGAILYMFIVYPISQEFIGGNFTSDFWMFAGSGLMFGSIPLVLILIGFGFVFLFNFIYRRMSLKSFFKKELLGLKKFYSNEKYPNFEIPLFSKSGFTQTLKAYKVIDKENNIPLNYLNNKKIHNIYNENIINNPLNVYKVPEINLASVKKKYNPALKGSTIVTIILFIWGLLPLVMTVAGSLTFVLSYGKPTQASSIDSNMSFITNSFLDIVAFMLYSAVILVSVYLLIVAIKYKTDYKKKKGIVLSSVDLSFSSIFLVVSGIFSLMFYSTANGKSNFPTDVITQMKEKYEIDYQIPTYKGKASSFRLLHNVGSSSENKYDNINITIQGSDSASYEEFKTYFINPNFLDRGNDNSESSVYVSADYKLFVHFDELTSSNNFTVSYSFSVDTNKDSIIRDRIDTNYINYILDCLDNNDYIGKFDYSVLESELATKYLTKYSVGMQELSIQMYISEDNLNSYFDSLKQKLDEMNYQYSAQGTYGLKITHNNIEVNIYRNLSDSYNSVRIEFM